MQLIVNKISPLYVIDAKHNLASLKNSFGTRVRFFLVKRFNKIMCIILISLENILNNNFNNNIGT